MNPDPLAALKAEANLRSLAEQPVEAPEASPPPVPAERLPPLNERVDDVRVMHVVRVSMRRGTGTAGDPVRPVVRFYDFDGNLLAERDSIEELVEAAAG